MAWRDMARMMEYMQKVGGGSRGGFGDFSPRIPAERYRLNKAMRGDIVKGNIQKVKGDLGDMGYSKKDIGKILDRYSELRRKEEAKEREASRTRSSSRPRKPTTTKEKSNKDQAKDETEKRRCQACGLEHSNPRCVSCRSCGGAVDIDKGKVLSSPATAVESIDKGLQDIAAAKAKVAKDKAKGKTSIPPEVLEEDQ